MRKMKGREASVLATARAKGLGDLRARCGGMLPGVQACGQEAVVLEWMGCHTTTAPKELSAPKPHQ